MVNPELQRLQDLFALAVDQPREQWLAILTAAAPNEPDVVAAVMAMLESTGADESFLQDVQQAVRDAVTPDQPDTVLPPMPTPQPVRGAGSAEETLARLQSKQGSAAARYRQEGKIGHGGMGEVLRVHDADLDRDLAMKVVRESVANGPGGPGALQRFLHEAHITGQLDHPGVVPVHELGVDASGRPFFTMRLVRGHTAHAVFAAARAGADGWTRTRALEVILKVCDTMAFAHRKGVLHRDLKPSNVMVGDFGEVYVMDWGLAKIVGEAEQCDLGVQERSTGGAGGEGGESGKAVLTVDGKAIGTPSFMPPEQAAGRFAEIDQRADVYAIGAMLYQLLTGQAPYVAADSTISSERVVEAVKAGPPTPIHRLDKTVPPQLAAICDKAMARDPGSRYQDMPTLAADLRAYVDNRVVRAYRTGWYVETALWLRRNRGVAASLLALFVAMGTSGTVLYIQGGALSERNLRLEKETEKANAANVALTEQTKKADRAAKEAEAALTNFQAEQKKSVAETTKRRRAVQQQALGEIRSRATDAVQAIESVEDSLTGIVGVADPAATGEAIAASIPTILDRLARGIAGGGSQDWLPWVRGRLLVIHGDHVAALRVLDPALPTADAVKSDPLAGLLSAAVHSASGGAAAGLGDLRAAVTANLAALDRLRGVLRLLTIEVGAPERVGLERMAVRIARDIARLLRDAHLSARRELAGVLGDWPPLRQIRSAGRSLRSDAPVTLAPELRLLQAALDAASGRLAVALKALEGMPDPGLVADLSADILLRLGRAEGALKAVAVPDVVTLRDQHAMAVQAVRCLLALHRPQEALVRVEEDLRRLGATVLPRARLVSLVAQARAAAMAGETDKADRSLDSALRLPGADKEAVLLLRVRLLVERHPQQALAMLSPAAIWDFSAEGLLSVAEIAAACGEHELVDGLRSRIRVEELEVPTGEVRWRLLDSQALQRVRSPLAADAAQKLQRELSDLVRPDVAMRAWLHLASVAADDPVLGLQRLASAATAAERCLTMYSRFDRPGAEFEPWLFSGMMARHGEEAIDLLAGMAERVRPEDLALAWTVMEVFAEPGVRAACSHVGGWSPRFEAARADLLERAELAVFERKRRSFRLDGDVPQYERHFRSSAPVRTNLAAPHTASLAAVRQALRPDQAILVFAAGRARTVGFVVSRDRTALMPLAATAQVDSELAELHAVPAGNARVAARLRVLGSLLLGPMIREAGGPDRGVTHLVLAAPMALARVPLEECLVAVGGAVSPLGRSYEVVCTWSATAWLDVVAGRRRDRSSLKGLVLGVARTTQPRWSGGDQLRAFAEPFSEAADIPRLDWLLAERLGLLPPASRGGLFVLDAATRSSWAPALESCRAIGLGVRPQDTSVNVPVAWRQVEVGDWSGGGLGPLASWTTLAEVAIVILPVDLRDGSDSVIARALLAAGVGRVVTVAGDAVDAKAVASALGKAVVERRDLLRTIRDAMWPLPVVGPAVARGIRCWGTHE
ncbi:MAG: serine/threonine protein kinase [Planctomycetes bacterium]|nr:serine/threonine protein kinase [Planctomycetota bacterium]